MIILKLMLKIHFKKKYQKKISKKKIKKNLKIYLVFRFFCYIVVVNKILLINKSNQNGTFKRITKCDKRNHTN